MRLRPPLRSVLDTLDAEGRLSDADREAVRAAASALAPDDSTPWFLHAIMFGVAWLAAPCIAIAPLILIDDDVGGLVLGLGGCVAVCVLRRVLRHPLVAHLLLALSIVFQIVTVFSMGELLHDDESTALLSAALCGTLFFAYPDYLHRVATLCGFLTATAIFGVEAGVVYVLEVHAVVTMVGVAILWLPAPPKVLGRGAELARPAAQALLVAGLVFAALCGTAELRSALDGDLRDALSPPVAGLPLWALLLTVVVVRLRQCGVRLRSAPAGAAAALVALVVLAGLLPGHAMLPAALAGLLLAFQARDVVGVPAAAAGLVWELVFLWVGTEVEALERAFALLVTGAVLLGIWALVTRLPATGARSAT